MDRWSPLPFFVVLAFSLITWYVVEPIAGYHLADLWTYIKLKMQQWYLHGNQPVEYANSSIGGWLVTHIVGEDLTTREADDGSSDSSSLLVSNGPQNDKSGQRPSILYGHSLHDVTMTFYIQKGNDKHVGHILQSLLRYNVSQAVFFLDDEFVLKHPIMVATITHLGYTVKPWTNVNEYDVNYPPSTFNNIALTDREIMGYANKLSDAVTFVEDAVHYWDSSIIAFTPKSPPKFQYSDILLEAILNNAGNTLHFTDSNITNAKNVLHPTYPKKINMSLGNLTNNTLPTDFDTNVNPITDIIIANGSWTLDDLHKKYPDAIVELQEKNNDDNKEGNDNAFVINKTIVIEKDARLRIANETLFIQTSSQDTIPRRLDVIGGIVTVVNSTITSWDPEKEGPDINAYHPRPYLVARDGGKLNIINSSVTHLGFPLGGLADTRYARAALEYRNTENFTIANSTIAHNYYGFYTSGARNFTILGNEIYANTRYGLDPHTGSEHMIIDSNHIHDNGNQGIICSKFCKNVTVTNNIVEHNVEGIGLHWLTNSSLIQDNVVKYNAKYGIYIDKLCYDNMVRNNTVTGNKNGVGILDRSHNNTAEYNVFEKNTFEPVVVDQTSGRSNNILKNNVIIN